MLRHGSEKILVCMPTYHSPLEWLERSTKSLIVQTHSNFECYAVKDGCAQACTFTHFQNSCLECENCAQTECFFKQLAKDDKRFKYYNLAVNHSGAGWGPRNFAIMNTSHRLIAYLDDDNWYEPEHLESLYATMEKTNADMCYTGTMVWDKNGNLVATRLHNREPSAGNIDTSEIMHTRRLINKHGGWRYVKKCNDWDMVSRWFPGVKWSHTNKVTLNFYLREGCGIHRR